MKKRMSYCLAALVLSAAASLAASVPTVAELAAGFQSPPLSARPGVYWYFMDGNLSKEGVTRDLEAMRDAGIGYAVFLEVNVGVPRGPVDFMSEAWIDFFRHLVKESERCDVQIVLGIGPGWCGSGGPWVKGSQSMRHLVSSERTVTGGRRVTVSLDKPAPRNPFFGVGQFPPKMRQDWESYYEDVAVLAFPSSRVAVARISDVDEKTHVYRPPYSSQPGVRQYFPATARPAGAEPSRPGLEPGWVLDLTDKMAPDGTLVWDAPQGTWTVLRFGARNNGAVTRPAPLPGVGMECDKFDDQALADHFAHFTDKLFAAVGERPKTFGGIKYLHIDSWEMGAQNWTGKLREEFTRRRGYDPLPFYPAYAGYVVGDETLTERFLWDLRQTSQELIVEKHALAVKRYAHAHGCEVSCEPYDMNPVQDLELAAAVDLPMAEFWCEGYGFNTSWTAFEASSASHLLGQSVVPAEAFTAHCDAWRPYPGSMKNQTDWALAAGINRFMFHTYQHQPLAADKKPGMTMGPYGVHWDRNQTWWPLAGAYHTYLARCQYLLQQGRTVSDILYLVPEGNPHVFRAPASALASRNAWLPNRRGYGFDGCPASLLMKASVKEGKVVFPGGAEYRRLILPRYETMTPRLLTQVRDLVKAGATVVGLPPRCAPGLTDYPACDRTVQALAAELWGAGEPVRQVGRGRVVRPVGPDDNLYQGYAETARQLAADGLPPDFEAEGADLRFAHRTSASWDLYFVSNTRGEPLTCACTFRVAGAEAEVWDALTGDRTSVPAQADGARTRLSLSFAPHQSFFVVFPHQAYPHELRRRVDRTVELQTVPGPWRVTFNPPVGTSFVADFATLADWTTRPEEGIRHFSGCATYRTTFDCAALPAERVFLSLGTVKNMARVTCNGHDLGVQWTDPWRVEVTGLLQPSGNVLEVTVANLWTNRLVGDESLPAERRTTFATWHHYNAGAPLEPSGLLGPVKLVRAAE